VRGHKELFAKKALDAAEFIVDNGSAGRSQRIEKNVRSHVAQAHVE
jgi:hypothetical protein